MVRSFMASSSIRDRAILFNPNCPPAPQYAYGKKEALV